MNIFTKAFIVTLLVTSILTVAFFVGYLTHAHSVAPDNEFSLLKQAYDILLTHGLNEPPSPPVLEYGMIRGMLQAYGDPYTSFSEPIQHELSTDYLQGSFGGIGVTLGYDADGFHILFPFPDSPASSAGVVEGDRLLAVDDLEISPESLRENILAAIHGPVGEEVTLIIAHPPDYNPQSITIIKEEISLPSVTWHLDPTERRLGVIKINILAASTAEEVLKAVNDLQSRGATHVVLDLRDNNGGLLTAGVETASLFLQDGVIIEQQYRGKPVEVLSVEHPGPLSDIPLIVLVNQYTASAAEIIAGALQAHDRALLIGSPTYGKDTIQLIFELEDGSSLHITAARWWVPGLDVFMSGRGFHPDLEIPTDDPDPNLAIQASIQTFFGDP